MKIPVKSFWPGAVAFVGASVLFLLPGKEFPEEDWFKKIFLDKWIHIGLFVTLVTLWSLPFIYRIKETTRLLSVFLWIALGFVAYGICIEFVQGAFIPFRTFGVDDMVADAIGCGVGFLLARNQMKNQQEP